MSNVLIDALMKDFIKLAGKASILVFLEFDYTADPQSKRTFYRD